MIKPKKQSLNNKTNKDPNYIFNGLSNEVKFMGLK